VTAAVPAVEVQGLVKRYGERAVVDAISFAIGRGEIVALLGPNGAGKTTTVEILEGYRAADGGTVRVLGADPARGGVAHRARVGLMLQGGGVDPRISAREALRLYASLHAQSRDPEPLLDLVGLRAVADTRYRRLSGGERQRLGFALALVGDPELLILDEPTAGMDPAARRDTRGLIGTLRSEGRTILLTTHDLADVERLADRVLILHRGRIVAEGPPADVGRGAAGRVWLRLERVLADAEIADLATDVGGRIRAAGGQAGTYTVEVDGPLPGAIAALAACCAARAIRIVELRTGAGSLEERYLELTGDADVERGA
jgi:ABC-2 type transport system ATP-binding protein